MKLKMLDSLAGWLTLVLCVITVGFAAACTLKLKLLAWYLLVLLVLGFVVPLFVVAITLDWRRK